MKSFFTVLKFELLTMLRKKSFIVSTIIIVVIACVALSIPRFSSLFSGLTSGSHKQETIMIYDQNKVFTNKRLIKSTFANDKIVYASSSNQVEKAVKDKSAKAGFVVQSDTNFTYYVENSSITDENIEQFKSLMSLQYQSTQLTKNGYDTSVVSKIYNTPIQATTQVIGTDGVKNYFYTYVMIFLLFFMIMLYGNQIGIGVASEKSNRAIEILTTSCSSNALIFGKVIAGAIMGIIQVTCIIGSVLIVYKLNASGWHHGLDAYLNIPPKVLVTFAIFGILGYLLYSFLYGAIGALVSKTEEVNGATAPIQILMFASFYLAILTLILPDSIVSKVASFFPFTSSICMFVNVAQGGVSLTEVIISLAILLATTILMGMLGAKLYRRGTMSYGNKVKFKHIIKMLKQKE